MAYSTLETISDLGIGELLNFPNLDTPIFYPMFLLVIFFVFTSLSFFREVGREGRGNILSSLAIGGYVTISVATILSLLGLIQTAILVTTVVIGLIFSVLYLLTRKD